MLFKRGIVTYKKFTGAGKLEGNLRAMLKGFITFFLLKTYLLNIFILIKSCYFLINNSTNKQ